MKHLIIIPIALIMFFSIYGCENENTTSKEALNQVRKVVDAAWLSEDADLMATYFRDDIVLMPPNMGKIIGKEENYNFLLGFFENFTMTELKTIERDVIVSGNWAIEKTLYEWVIVPEGSSEGVSDQINFIGIWQEQSDAAWKEVSAIWNSTKSVVGTQ